MKYQAIKKVAENYPIGIQCELLDVSESGYYAWLKREPSQRSQEDAQLKPIIRKSWDASRRSYGVPRVYQELQDQGLDVGRNRIARLMREIGIQGKTTRKKRPKTTQSNALHAAAPNHLNREFTAETSNQVWLCDITYIDTEEGFLYLAAIIDIYSRQIVGFSMDTQMPTDLVTDALDMALLQRDIKPHQSNLMFHSDRGSQYTSHRFQVQLKKYAIKSSMSRVGNCWDNAPIESFWATLKRECADLIFATFDEARSEIFSYIMGFYNQRRRHSALGYLSPVLYENLQLQGN